MRRRHLLHAGTALASTLLAGCSLDEGTSPNTSSGTDTPACQSTPRVTAPGPENAGTIDTDRIVQLSGPPCQAVVGATFVTVRKHPSNGNQIRYSAEFTESELSWVTGDQFFIQNYRCRPNDCQAIIETDPVLGSESPIRWVYDTRTGVLKKGDNRYRPTSK